MYKIMRATEADVRKIAETKTAFNLITKDISPHVSLAVLEAGNHKEIETTQYDRIYFVLSGELRLKFEGKEYLLNVGDTCFVGKGTTYEMAGTFTIIVVNQPAFGS